MHSIDLSYFVTSTDLQSIFKNCKIVKYADLDQYTDIYQLLPNRMDFVFLLTESEKNSGHLLLSVPKRTMPASCEVRSDINLHS